MIISSKKYIYVSLFKNVDRVCRIILTKKKDKYCQWNYLILIVDLLPRGHTWKYCYIAYLISQLRGL